MAATRRTRTVPVEPPPTRPDELHGGKDGPLWSTALELAGGDRGRIEIESRLSVRVTNPPD